jgi:hypothetical protein
MVGLFRPFRRRLSLGLVKIKPQLPKFGRLLWVNPRLQIGFFQEIPPTRAPVFLTLTPFKIVESSLPTLGSFDDSHNPARHVGFLVEPNDRE